MITNEEHEDFLKQIDLQIESFMDTCDSLDETVVEFAIDKFCMIRLGKTLPIKWVKLGDGIKEFYPSDLNMSWLITYINYHNKFLNKEGDLELLDIKHSCIFLGLALSKIRGINIVDDTVYLLRNDLELVDYKLNKQIFI
jgi:hypothetical protein